MTGPVLEALDVAHRYGDTDALRGVDLAVEAGTCVALVGESGSGKTTLLRCFNRLVEPTRGTVRVRGRPVDAVPPEVLRRSIGYVPQHGGLLPHWTVLRNTALVPHLLGRPDADRAGADALARVGLDPTEFGARWPRTLSGGQRQRVALARALAAGPDVVLLDEPFGALDAITRSEVARVFAALRADRGFTAVLVTHDLREAFALADEVVVLRHGSVEQRGTAAELTGRPRTPWVRELLDRAGVAS